MVVARHQQNREKHRAQNAATINTMLPI